MRKKEVGILVYSPALIHHFNNTMITYIPFYKVNSPTFLLLFVLHFFHPYTVLLFTNNALVYMNKFEFHLG